MQCDTDVHATGTCISVAGVQCRICGCKGMEQASHLAGGAAEPGLASALGSTIDDGAAPVVEARKVCAWSDLQQHNTGGPPEKCEHGSAHRRGRLMGNTAWSNPQATTETVSVI